MPHSFTNQVDHLAWRQRGRSVATATSWALVAAVAYFLLLLAFDRLLTPESQSIRLLFTAAGSAGIALIVVWWWRQVLQSRTSALAIALQIEKVYPELRDVAASALNFANRELDDPLAGSESLRRAVVLRANALSESMDWRELSPSRPFRLATRVLAAVLMILFLLAWWSPQTLAIGWKRISLPFGSTHWPRENNLEFVDPPERALAGAHLELTLRDTSGLLPEDAQVHLRQWRNGRWHRQVLPLSRSNESATALLANIQQAAEFRAVGGDHRTMPWSRVDVVAPPRVQSLKVVVQPPGYSGIEAFDWQPGLQLLEGSNASVAITCDRQIQSATLFHQSGKQYPGQLASTAESARFQMDKLTVHDSGTYHVELSTSDQLSARTKKQISLDVVADLPPSVRFVIPDKRQLLATPQASIILRIDAQDDLALSEVGCELRALRTNDVLNTQSLWKSPDSDPTSSMCTTGTLEISQSSVNLGEELTLVGWARDLRPQAAETAEPVSIRIVSEEELKQWLSERERRIQALLRKAIDLQDVLRSRTSAIDDLLTSQDEQARLQIHALLFGQRRITGMLLSETDSAYQLAEEALRAIERNHMPLGDTQRTMRSVRDAVGQLGEGSFPLIEASLTAAARHWELDQEPDVAEVRRELLTCSKAQIHVISVLEQLFEDVSRGTDVAQVVEELNSVSAKQEGLADDSQRLMRQWLVQPEQFPAAQTKESARQQKSLARRMASLSQRMEALAEQLAERYPELSRKLEQACTTCKKAGVTGKMYDAAEQLNQGRLSNSNQLQRQVADEIRKLSDVLARQSEPESEPKSAMQGNALRENARPSDKPGVQPSERSETTKGQLAEVATREQVAALVDALWGHLPERQRQQILQPLGDDFLPEYAEEIKEYFRALANPDVVGERSP